MLNEKKQKKVLPFIIIVLLLASIIPISAFAAETVTSENQDPTEITAETEAGTKTENVDILDEEDEIVNIPDRNLKLCICRAINKPDGDITKTDMLQLEELDTGGVYIKDLTGLEYAKNLRVAYIEDTGVISDVSSLSGLTDLGYLFSVIIKSVMSVVYQV
ncbi:MAG: hypothetical protein AAGU27_20040 [Dehalobacterium sp.]